MTDKESKEGRPKEPFQPWDGWVEDILSLYGEGASDVEIRGLIIEKNNRSSCSFALWDRWLKEEPEFFETIKMGRILCNIWWEKNGRENLKDRDFNPTLWYMNMRNRFGWADKHDIKQTLSADLKHDFNPEDELKERGIPTPEMPLEDLGDMDVE